MTPIAARDAAERIAASYALLSPVTAVAMAGSRAASVADAASDLDLYVYAVEPIPLAERAAIATRFGARREVGNTIWEPGDEWLDAETGLHVDVMFRTPTWIAAELDRVLLRHEASVGYSTCFWCNVLHSTVLFDRVGWYATLRERAVAPYPEELKQAIIAKNHPILRRALSSYLGQIERAVHRGDALSAQHRIAALLASYFDILFAVNETPHPGEKRMLPLATRLAKTTPNLTARVNDLLAVAIFPPDPTVVARVEALLDDLDAMLARDGLLPRHDDNA
ncbi:MAG: DUF4037 domain-containing protein [Thermomicrobiales bacterium]|nr:DUF4037 domain-containing protein [Thermomicrobiales bacterium]